MTFEDVYLIPNLGALIWSFLPIEDEMRMDSVSTTIRQFHREWVYPTYRSIDIDTLCTYTSSSVSPPKYLTKLSPYLEEITCVRNEQRLKLPRIEALPNLKRITYAVPFILDTTLRRIHPHTQMLWAAVNTFIRTSMMRPNQIESIDIVPGVILCVRTDPEDDENYLEQHILEDTTEGSHLQLFNRYGMPVIIMLPPAYLQYIPMKFPFRMANYVGKTIAKRLHYTDWSVHEWGVASLLLDLID